MLPAEGRKVIIQGIAQHEEGLAVKTESIVGRAEHGLQMGTARGLAGQLGLNLVGGVIEIFGHRDGAAVALRVRAPEQLGKEGGNSFGFLSGLFLGVAFARGTDGLPGTGDGGDDEDGGNRRRHPEGGLVALSELAEPVACGRGARAHRFVGQMASDVQGERVGRLVAARAVLVERLHHDPVQIAAQRFDEPGRIGVATFGCSRQLVRPQCAQASGRTHGLLLANDAAHCVQAGFQQFFGIEGRAAGEQFVEQNTQAVDVAAGVDVQAGQFGLLGAHVSGRAQELQETGEYRLVRKSLLSCLGDAEVDDLGCRLAVVEGDEDVRWFEVSVDDTLLVRMLHGVADLNEQLQAFLGREVVPIAVIGDANSPNQFHDEVRAAGFRCAAVVDLGDVRVVHQRQGLPFGFEAGDDFTRVHAQLDDFEGHATPDRFLLLGHPDVPEAAGTDFLQQFVAAYAVALLFGQRVGRPVRRLGRRAGWSREQEGRAGCGLMQESAGLVVCRQQRLDFVPQAGITGASLIQVCQPFPGVADGRGRGQHSLDSGVCAHGLFRPRVVLFLHTKCPAKSDQVAQIFFRSRRSSR